MKLGRVGFHCNTLIPHITCAPRGYVDGMARSSEDHEASSGLTKQVVFTHSLPPRFTPCVRCSERARSKGNPSRSQGVVYLPSVPRQTEPPVGRSSSSSG